MCKSSLYLVLLATGLVVCWAKPADVVARVPSNYYAGTKWVLFRDDSIPDPPPNVIQADNEVQVLPTYRYAQQYPQFVTVTQTPIHIATAPEHTETAPQHIETAPQHIETAPEHTQTAPQHIETAPQHFEIAPVLGDYDSEVVEGKSGFGAAHGFTYQKSGIGFANHYHHQPAVKFGTVTAVPHSAVHVQGPSYYDFLRKKKSA